MFDTTPLQVITEHMLEFINILHLPWMFSKTLWKSKHLSPMLAMVCALLIGDSTKYVTQQRLQVITEHILEFLIKLDVKEIHGYDAQLGLRCFTQVCISGCKRSHSLSGIGF